MGFDELHGLIGLQRHHAARAHDGVGGGGLVEIDPLHGGAARMTGQSDGAAAGCRNGCGGGQIDTFVGCGGAAPLTSQGNRAVNTADGGASSGQINASITSRPDTASAVHGNGARARGHDLGPGLHQDAVVIGGASMAGAAQADVATRRIKGSGSEVDADDRTRIPACCCGQRIGPAAQHNIAAIGENAAG